MVVFFPLAIGLWIAERVQLNWVQMLFVEILLAALQGTMVIWIYPGLWQKIVAIQETPIAAMSEAKKVKDKTYFLRQIGIETRIN